MDYGQTNDNQKIDRLFEQAITSGEGTAPDSSNPDVAESLHSTDSSINWETQPDAPNSAELSKRGRDAMSSSLEVTPDLLPTSPDRDSSQLSRQPEASLDPTRLGEIVPLSMPPGSQPPTPDSINPTADNGPASILSHLHLDSHQKFTDADVKLVDAAIAASGDDIADFYTAVRNLAPLATVNQESGQHGK